MKITLIMPQSKAYSKGGAFSNKLRYAPLTLTTLAALVPKELNAEIEIIDEGMEDLKLDAINEGLVGITCITPNASKVYEISKILRSKGVTTVIGGIHPTLVPEEVQPHADSIVTGYAEHTWPELLLDWQKGKLKPRYDQSAFFKFENMPDPRRDLVANKGYVTINTVQATRGCPHKCNFCVVPSAWPKYLHRPIKEVIAEIDRLEGDRFLFLDLSPIEDERYIKQLYRELAPLKKKWGGLATIRIAYDREMLTLAQKSGCRGLLIGIESINPQTLDQMVKPFNQPHEYLEACKILHDHGIAINGCFVFGLDGDKEEVFEKTLEFVFKANIDLPRYSIATPFPGTALYKQLKAQNRLLTEEWVYYGGQNVVYKPIGMSAKKLQEGIRFAWRETYKLSGIVKRVFGSKASRSLEMLGTSLASNVGYNMYSRLMPEYITPPCELDPWDNPGTPEYILESEPTPTRRLLHKIEPMNSKGRA